MLSEICRRINCAWETRSAVLVTNASNTCAIQPRVLLGAPSDAALKMLTVKPLSPRRVGMVETDPASVIMNAELSTRGFVSVKERPRRVGTTRTVMPTSGALTDIADKSNTLRHCRSERVKATICARPC